MFINTLGFFINFVFHIFVAFADTSAKAVLLQMSPDEVINTVKALASSSYIRQLASEFAVRTAQHILLEMKNKDNLNKIDSQNERLNQELTDESFAPIGDKTARNYEVELNEDEVSTLLEAPLPDGDNIDAVTTLSDEDNGNNKTVPVIGIMKINGIYYRRLLGVL